jgi:mannose-6-phosphate isomerase-like protein (cupin superfamily)
VRVPVAVAFRGAGTVVCKRHPGRVEAGDCVAHLAAPVQG